MNSSLLRSLFENSNCGLAVCDPEHRLIHVNPAFEQLTEGACSGGALTDVCPWVSESGLMTILNDVVSAGRVVRLEKSVPELGRTFDINAFPLSEGEYCLSLTDITERWLREQESRESAALFRTLFDSVQAGVCVVRADGAILHANRVAKETFGIGSGEFPTTHYPRISIADEDGTPLAEDQTPWQVVLRTGRPVRARVRGMLPEGSTFRRWILSNAEPVFDANGDVREVILSFLDITARKQAEDAIRDAARETSDRTGTEFLQSLVRHFARTLNAAFAVIGERSGDGRRVYCHALYSHGEVTTGFEYDLRGTPCEKVTGRQICSYPRNVQSLFPEDSMLVEMRVEAFVGMPLFDAAGDPLGLIVVMWTAPLEEEPLARSILRIYAARAAAELERQRSENALLRRTRESEAAQEGEREAYRKLQLTVEELAAARLKAELANQAKSDFLATVSHEMRTPLHAIIGIAELQLSSNLSVDNRQDAESICNAATALLHLINDLLDFAKIESGKLVIEEEAFDLPALVGQALNTVRPETRRKELKIEAHIAAAVPRFCTGDPGRVRQILVNLLSNAVKFTTAGEVRLEVLAAGEDRVLFTVSDTGIGIPEPARPNLFEPFVQADTSTTRRFGGTGLGLAICKRLVEAMRGEIGFESEDGAGSMFWFRIPMRPAAEARQLVEAQCPARLREPCRVLLVEDNPVNQRITARLLERLGVEVAIAGDGSGAIVLARERQFDAILMDCQMPGMDGMQASREIRMLELDHRRTPIIALTANTLSGVRDSCLEAGMDDYISKPVTLAELERKLVQWVRPAVE